MKQAYVSISDLLWENHPNLEFEQLKAGYVGEVAGRKYRIVSGIPQDAKLVSVLYLFEHPELPDTKNPFDSPPIVVTAEHFT